MIDAVVVEQRVLLPPRIRDVGGRLLGGGHIGVRLAIFHKVNDAANDEAEHADAADAAEHNVEHGHVAGRRL